MMSRGRNKKCPGEVMGDKSYSEVIEISIALW